MDWTPVRAARLVHVSGVTAALGDASRAIVRQAMREARRLSFDANYRSLLWSPAEARAFIAELMPARYLFLGDTEAQIVLGLDGAAETMVEAIARLAPKATATILRGQEGSLTGNEGELIRPSRRHTVKVVDPIGADIALVTEREVQELLGGAPDVRR